MIGILGVVRVVLVVNPRKARKKSRVRSGCIEISGGTWGQINYNIGAIWSEWEGDQGGGLHLFRGQGKVIGRSLSWRRALRRVLGSGIVHVEEGSEKRRV